APSTSAVSTRPDRRSACATSAGTAACPSRTAGASTCPEPAARGVRWSLVADGDQRADPTTLGLGQESELAFLGHVGRRGLPRLVGRPFLEPHDDSLARDVLGAS